MIAVVTHRAACSVRTCSSLSQTYGHRIAPSWTRLIMPSAVPFSRWSTIVKVSSQLTNWNDRLSDCRGMADSTAIVYRQERRWWHRRLEWLRSASAGEHIELMFIWHVKCWLCVPVLLLWMCFVRFDVKKNKLLPFVTYYSYCHSLHGATLFFEIDSKKLRFNVKNGMTLYICANFDADLINISKVTNHKTKWPRFLSCPV